MPGPKLAPCLDPSPAPSLAPPPASNRTLRRALGSALMGALLLLLAAATLPAAAQAQGTATLLADRIEVDGEDRLRAEGNVEVFYDGTRMTAAAVVYDRAADRLEFTGPLVIVSPDGAVLAAEEATLDPQLRNGLLRGARLVLDRRLQLAATRIDRAEGRYSQLRGAAATACSVCGDRAPLWDIRATRVLHDEDARQLYFENAIFRVRGIPLLWLPRLRLPDPTLNRARGLLLPDIVTNDRLGFGLKFPYFIPIGDHRDLTLRPYLSAQTRTLEARYRQAFRRGTIEVNAAFSEDTLVDPARAYLFLDGDFALGRGYRLDFGLQGVTDDTYLIDYGYSFADRLRSGATLQRVRPDEMLRGRLAYFDSLRQTESDGSLPPYMADLRYERRLRPSTLGGTLALSGEVESFLRTEGTPGEAGRDVTRAGAGARWQRDWVIGPGVLAEARSLLALDYYAISDDPQAPRDVLRAAPGAGVSLRWPLVRQEAGGGVTDVLEPYLGLSWSDLLGEEVPNEDSTQIEFDEANLFFLDRFPGEDARETGSRTTLALSWTRSAPSGAAAALTFGRVLRDEPVPEFTRSSGLAGRQSDWLVAARLDLPRGFSLNTRTIFDQDFDFAKTGGRLDWRAARFDIGATYVWLPPDPDEQRTGPVSEWAVNGGYRVSERLSLRGDARYDVAASRPRNAGLAIAWQNECVTVDLSLARRYTSSGKIEPSTEFGVQVGLTGFSAGRSGGPVPGRCAP